MMQGRWTLWLDELHQVEQMIPDNAEQMPVVPCDDAAIQRGAEAVRDFTGGHYSTELAEAVLRAAGETP